MKNGLLKRAALAATLATALVVSSCNDSEMSVTIPNTVRIHAGTFMMGSPAGEIGRDPLEFGEDHHSVTLTAGFYMGRFPVTQWQWVEVMGSNPVPGDSVHYGRWRPVVNVNWFDTIVFANRLSIMEGLSPAYRIGGSTNPNDWGEVPRAADSPNIDAWSAVEMVAGSNGWRLPTDAQWEYAARAGTTTAFSNGTQDWNDQASLDGIGWFNFNSGGRTHDVGRKAANPWGLHDMHGNVWEWTWDWYEALGTDPATDPSGASSGSGRVFRGGCWLNIAVFVDTRIGGNPFIRDDSMGVRLVRP
ncbi:MAG: formylglycine-generating enzyme family protein [Spirochaetes bacterium]|nr:formylglycine-generating enzyme family protein [Spirochaetota bacterium]